jgi:hypothetical protein
MRLTTDGKILLVEGRGKDRPPGPFKAYAVPFK